MMLESDTDPEELQEDFPEAYQLLENFVEADNTESTKKLGSLYYESSDLVMEIKEKYGEESQEYEEISKMRFQLAAARPYR